MKSSLLTSDSKGWVNGKDLETIFKQVAAKGKKHTQSLASRFRSMIMGGAHFQTKTLRGNTMTAQEMDNTLADLGNSFKVLAKRQLSRSGGLQHKVLASIEDQQTKFADESFLSSLNDTMLAARGDGADAVAAKEILAAIVKTVIYTYVMADSRWGDFFQVVNLANNDEAVIEYGSSKQKLQVGQIGMDGGFRLVQPEMRDGMYRNFINMIEIATSDYEYPVRDLNKGDIRQSMISLVDHAMALADAIDSMLASLIQVSGMPASPFTAAFDYTSANEWDRHFTLDPRVNAANLPTGNFIALASNTSTSKVRTEVLDAIIQYAGMWGGGFENDTTPLALEAVHVASRDAYGFLGAAGVGSQMNFLTDQIFRSGQVASYANQNFNWVSDNTIDPDQGILYARFNRPVGMLFRKPGLDQVLHDTSIALQKQNKERMTATAVLAPTMIKQHNRYVLAVKYRS